MVKSSSPTLDAIFSALSDPTRRKLLEGLALGEKTVTEVAAPFFNDMSLPAISKHLRILEEAGLIVRRKQGRVHHLQLAAAPMKEASEWLDIYRQFWDAQFDALAQFLREQKDNPDDQS
jgi:DNA-binding transcriptional ArsR family regulator